MRRSMGVVAACKVDKGVMIQRAEVSKPVLLAGDGKAATQADLRDLNPLHDAAGVQVLCLLGI